MATRLTALVHATLVTIVMMATGVSGVTAETTPAQPASKSSIEAQNVGVFTGKVVNGMPLYELPSITVIGHRKVELAKLKREEQLARSKQVRARVVSKGPA
ncbi:MAG TPA: hypothetical protein VEO36_05015 [Casimicrobiaceae bacterium]|nr:hypothetical protein [Casimicrobiaceae bacterium]